jgi:hypothetical protein
MEPEIVKWMAWNTNEIKLAMSLEESIDLLNKPNINRTLKNVSKFSYLI